jgi:hypothetical protein
MAMNGIEREAIILNSAWEMIDGMVNWAMFLRNDCTKPTNLMFETRQHSRLFVILLGDFLSEVRAFKGDPVPLGLKSAPSNARPSDLTFLFHLRQVCGRCRTRLHSNDAWPARQPPVSSRREASGRPQYLALHRASARGDRRA